MVIGKYVEQLHVSVNSTEIEVPQATTYGIEETVAAQLSKGKNKSIASKKKGVIGAVPTKKKVILAASNVKISRLGVSDTYLKG